MGKVTDLGSLKALQLACVRGCPCVFIETERTKTCLNVLLLYKIGLSCRGWSSYPYSILCFLSTKTLHENVKRFTLTCPFIGNICSIACSKIVNRLLTWHQFHTGGHPGVVGMTLWTSMWGYRWERNRTSVTFNICYYFPLFEFRSVGIIIHSQFSDLQKTENKDNYLSVKLFWPFSPHKCLVDVRGRKQNLEPCNRWATADMFISLMWETEDEVHLGLPGWDNRRLEKHCSVSILVAPFQKVDNESGVIYSKV